MYTHIPCIAFYNILPYIEPQDYTMNTIISVNWIWKEKYKNYFPVPFLLANRINWNELRRWKNSLSKFSIHFYITNVSNLKPLIALLPVLVNVNIQISDLFFLYWWHIKFIFRLVSILSCLTINLRLRPCTIPRSIPRKFYSAKIIITYINVNITR